MLKRTTTYLIILCSALLAGCTQEEEGAAPPSENVVPIAFDCGLSENYRTYRTYKTYKTYKTYETHKSYESYNSHTTRAANGYTGNITAENHQLHYTGFGVFMAHDGESAPDIMYNQQVEYTFMADGSDKGYWTYAPLKYWPAQPVGVTIYAYAPYTTIPDPLPDGTTGITGMSDNTETTPYIIYTRARHPEENVDLLWDALTITGEMLDGDEGRPYISKAVALDMHHALARVQLSLGITNGTALPAGARLLVKRISLTGNFAKSGKLDLTATDAAPTWFGQVLATGSDPEAEKTIFIDSDPETNTASYGIIDETVRYIPALPSRWQPAGMAHKDYDATDPAKKENRTNLLCMGDAVSYLYLIPQADLSMTCTLDYCIIAADGTLTDYHKTTATEATPIHIAPLAGDKTYDVTLKITL